MIPGCDPASLGPDGRRAEVAALLAAGYRLLALKRQKALEMTGEHMAACRTPVHRTENRERRGPPDPPAKEDA